MTKPSVVVITPTTGDPKLIRCVESVARQTYKGVRHLIVLDGQRFRDDFNKTIYQDGRVGLTQINPNVWTLNLPFNTGANRFYGHRVYAGVSHLVDDEVVFFLDQDNTYEPNHVETMVDRLCRPATILNFAFSLRNIYDKDGNFLCQDNCENLGKWPVWNDDQNYLVDTSAYAFDRSFLVTVANHWHSGYAGDRRFLQIMRQIGAKYECTGQYSMNYYLDGGSTSPSPEYFTKGNEAMAQKYNAMGSKYPWVNGLNLGYIPSSETRKQNLIFTGGKLELQT